jgi:hypothetical protein
MTLVEAPLKPAAEETDGGAEEPELVLALIEVEGVELGGAKVFEVVERGKFGGGFARGHEELEGFAGELDAGSEGVVSELLEEGQRGAGLAVVKDEA